MLYGIGLIMLLLSAAFVGGSVLVPAAMAAIGIVFMRLGRRFDNGTEKNTERQDPCLLKSK